MDHETYENQMIDGVNRNADENSKPFEEVPQVEEVPQDSTVTPKRNQLIDKTDRRILMIGFKRTLLALFTAALFALSVIGFIEVAHAPGYMAVALFVVSILEMVSALILLYAQGIITRKMQTESQGESK